MMTHIGLQIPNMLLAILSCATDFCTVPNICPNNLLTRAMRAPIDACAWLENANPLNANPIPTAMMSCIDTKK